MNWETYKQQVAGSREVIVFPFFLAQLSGASGTGVDIGCGNGDLTAHISGSTRRVVGVDCDKQLLKDARLLHRGMHFVYGEVDKNSLPAIGITFDFAFSNCCLCHLSDEGVYSLLMDLFSSMREGADLVFTVPSPTWAREMYSDIKYEKSGISAVPRFGARQHFRTPEWYVSALDKCGFDLVSHEEIEIPDDIRLESRYRDNVGRGLFSAFVTKRGKILPNADVMKAAFDVAHDNRKLEIQLFWQRSLFFWGFVAAALLGYGAAYKDHSNLALVFALFGLVCSVVWSAGNRGSKYWQEYWEKKVTFFQHYSTGNIFYDRDPKTAKIYDVYAPRRMSVSKLTMAMSDYAVVLWLALIGHWTALRYFPPSPELNKFVLPAAIVLTLGYCVYFLWRSKSED